MDIPTTLPADAAGSTPGGGPRFAQQRKRAAFAGRQVSPHPQEEQGRSASGVREAGSDIDATLKRRRILPISSTPIQRVSDRPEPAAPPPGPAPAGADVALPESARVPSGAPAQESSWFTAYFKLRVYCSDFSRRGMPDARRSYNLAISRISRRVISTFNQFVGIDKALPPVPHGITTAEQRYHLVQEMARDNASQGNKERADEILKALDDLRAHTVESVDQLIETHGEPDVLAVGEISPPATAAVPLAVETAPARNVTPATFDWHATICRMRSVSRRKWDFDAREIASAYRGAVTRISTRVLRTFKEFGGKTDNLNPGAFRVFSDPAYDALQAMVLHTGDELTRLAIRQSLYDIDQTTFREMNDLTRELGVPEVLWAHGTQAPATRLPVTAETTPWPAGAAAPHSGLQRAIESARSPHTTASSDAHGGSADPRRLTRVEAPLPGRADFQVGGRVPGIPPAETDRFRKAAEAASRPVPPLPSTVRPGTGTLRAPVLSHHASPGRQPDGALGFAGPAAGSGELAFSRRAEIVRRFTLGAALFEADVAYGEGRIRALGWSDTRWYRLRGDLLQLQATAQVAPGTAEAIENLDWHGLREFMRILDAPADLP